MEDKYYVYTAVDGETLGFFDDLADASGYADQQTAQLADLGVMHNGELAIACVLESKTCNHIYFGQCYQDHWGDYRPGTKA